MAQEITPADDIFAPHFEWASGELQFFVRIPANKNGKWTANLGGVFNPTDRRYTFLTSKLEDVERELGLQPGESGLKNPKYWAKITFTGEIYIGNGNVGALEKELQPHGVTFKKASKTFAARLEKLDELKPYLQKPPNGVH